MEAIKIFGLPRTCTNFTEAFLEKNFKVRVLVSDPIWKHGCCNLLYDTLELKNGEVIKSKFIICTKNPYSWFVSIRDYAYRNHKNKPLLKKYIKGDKTWRSNHYKEYSPINAYNKMHRDWLFNIQCRRSDKLIIKSEQISGDQKHIANKISDAFNVEVNDFKEIRKRVMQKGKITSSDYQTKDYMSEYDEELLDYVNERIDPEIMKLLGYCYY